MKILNFFNRTGFIAASVAIVSMIAGAGAMAALAHTTPDAAISQTNEPSSFSHIEKNENLSSEELERRQKDFDNRQKDFDNRQKDFDNRQKDFDNRQKDFDRRQKNFDRRQKNKLASTPNSFLGIKHIALRDFKGISVSGAINVVFTQGESDGYAEIHGDERALEYIRFDYNGGILDIGYDKSPGNISTRTIVYITYPVLDRIDLSGATSLTVQGMFLSKNLNVQVNGASDVNIPNVKGKTLNLSGSGASSINVLSAEMETISAEAVGASGIKLKGVCARTVNCNALAASEIYVTGRCNKKSSSELSAGKVKDQGLIIENAPVDCASTSTRKKTMPRKP